MMIFLKFFILFMVFTFINASASQEKPNSPIDQIELTKAEIILAENILNIIKLTEKGYVNHDVLAQVTRSTSKSKIFSIFNPWLQLIDTISKTKDLDSLLILCKKFSESHEKLPMEEALESVTGNYCREKSIETISRDVEKTNKLSQNSLLYIQENLKFLLDDKNNKTFSFFLRSQAKRPDILKIISKEVTNYSIINNSVPGHEVLKDIIINEHITKLIQDKGFNPLQHQNIFYAEFDKLIKSGYKLIAEKSDLSKLETHYRFLKNYFDLNISQLPIETCFGRMGDFAKAIFRSGYTDLSRTMLKDIISKNNPQTHEDSLFFYLWTYINKNENKAAFTKAKELGILNNINTIQDSKLKFWIAQLYEEMQNKKEAILIFENIIQTNPLSYYAIMAHKKLQTIKPDSPMVNFYIKNVNANIDGPRLNLGELDQDFISSLFRLKAWTIIDSERLTKLELKRIINYSLPSFLVKNPIEVQTTLRADIHLLNAKIIQQSGNYLSSFKYIFDLLEKGEITFSREMLEILYPRPFLELVSKNVKNSNYDPVILLSLIRQESVFNPKARSPVGARGLMQLMPQTARRLRRNVSEKNLVNPDINIQIGTKYFDILMKRYSGNLVYVLAAYNAGESRVDRWRASYFDIDASILKNIEEIPFLETRNYVKLIFRNIFFYKLLLDKKELLADSSSSNQIFDIHLGFNK